MLGIDVIPIMILSVSAASVIAVILGVWIVVKIIDYRDRHRKVYRYRSGTQLHSDADPDLTKYPVRIERTAGEYRINFVEDGETVYVIVLGRDKNV